MQFPQYQKLQPEAWQQFILISLAVVMLVMIAREIHLRGSAKGSGERRQFRIYRKLNKLIPRFEYFSGVVCALMALVLFYSLQSAEERSVEAYHSQISNYLSSELELKASIKDIGRLAEGGTIKATNKKGQSIAITLLGSDGNRPEVVKVYYTSI